MAPLCFDCNIRHIAEISGLVKSRPRIFYYTDIDADVGKGKRCVFSKERDAG